MSRMIGFDRRIRLEWLDAAASAEREIGEINEIRQFLHGFLEPEIPTYAARSKTVVVLTKIWSRVPEEHVEIRDRALDLFQVSNTQDRVWLHWGMALLAYPFFRDTVTTISRSLLYYDCFTKAEIVKRIKEDWGERTTLKRATERIVSSIFEWGVIVKDKETGKYNLPLHLTTESKQIEIWLLEAALLASQKQCIPLDQAFSIPEVFPFKFSLSIPEIVASNKFEMSQMGNNRAKISVIPTSGVR